MSLELSRQVDREHPDLLATNINATCYQHAVNLIALLRSLGHTAQLICKTAGEGQYTPPGFVPFDTVGLDGKGCHVTGVSHDAIWCNGLQFDTIGQGNDSPEPIFWPDGARIRGVPIWAPIAKVHWRNHNPPLLIDSIPPRQAPEPERPVFLPKGEAFMLLKALDAFYRAPEGLQRPEGIGGDMEAIAQWFYQLVIERVSLENVFTQIRNSHEWRSKHP